MIPPASASFSVPSHTQTSSTVYNSGSISSAPPQDGYGTIKALKQLLSSPATTIFPDHLFLYFISEQSEIYKDIFFIFKYKIYSSMLDPSFLPTLEVKMYSELSPEFFSSFLVSH